MNYLPWFCSTKNLNVTCNMHCIKLFDNVSLLNNNDAIGSHLIIFFKEVPVHEITDFSTGTVKRRLLSKHFLTGFLDIHFDVDDFATN